MSTKLTTLSIRIPEEMKERLRREAFNRSTFDAPVSTADVAREVMAAGFEASDIEEEEEERTIEKMSETNSLINRLNRR